MTIQFGAGKKIIYKEESELGVDPGASSAQQNPRVIACKGRHETWFVSDPLPVAHKPCRLAFLYKPHPRNPRLTFCLRPWQ